MIPINTIVAAARPYAIVAAQSAIVGGCVIGGYALGMLAMAGAIQTSGHLVGGAKRVFANGLVPGFLGADYRRAKARMREEAERARLRSVVDSFLTEHDRDRYRAGKPINWRDLPPDASGSPRPDGGAAPAST